MLEHQINAAYSTDNDPIVRDAYQLLKTFERIDEPMASVTLAVALWLIRDTNNVTLC